MPQAHRPMEVWAYNKTDFLSKHREREIEIRGCNRTVKDKDKHTKDNDSIIKKIDGDVQLRDIEEGETYTDEKEEEIGTKDRISRDIQEPRKDVPETNWIVRARYKETKDIEWDLKEREIQERNRELRQKERIAREIRERDRMLKERSRGGLDSLIRERNKEMQGRRLIWDRDVAKEENDRKDLDVEEIAEQKDLRSVNRCTIRLLGDTVCPPTTYIEKVSCPARQQFYKEQKQNSEAQQEKKQKKVYRVSSTLYPPNYGADTRSRLHMQKEPRRMSQRVEGHFKSARTPFRNVSPRMQLKPSRSCLKPCRHHVHMPEDYRFPHELDKHHGHLTSSSFVRDRSCAKETTACKRPLKHRKKIVRLEENQCRCQGPCPNSVVEVRTAFCKVARKNLALYNTNESKFRSIDQGPLAAKRIPSKSTFSRTTLRRRTLRSASSSHVKEKQATGARAHANTHQGLPVDAPIFIIRSIDRHDMRFLTSSQIMHVDVKPRIIPMYSPEHSMPSFCKNTILERRTNELKKTNERTKRTCKTSPASGSIVKMKFSQVFHTKKPPATPRVSRQMSPKSLKSRKSPSQSPVTVSGQETHYLTSSPNFTVASSVQNYSKRHICKKSNVKRVRSYNRVPNERLSRPLFRSCARRRCALSESPVKRRSPIRYGISPTRRKKITSTNKTPERVNHKSKEQIRISFTTKLRDLLNKLANDEQFLNSVNYELPPKAATDKEHKLPVNGKQGDRVSAQTSIQNKNRPKNANEMRVNKKKLVINSDSDRVSSSSSYKTVSPERKPLKSYQISPPPMTVSPEVYRRTQPTWQERYSPHKTKVSLETPKTTKEKKVIRLITNDKPLNSMLSATVQTITELQ